jgi:hypothetical protein
MIRTFHCYPDTLHIGGRLAEVRWQEWRAASGAEGVAATLEHEPEAVILRADSSAFSDVWVGLAPGGLSA